MWLHAVDLNKFYTSPVGRMAARTIGRHVRGLWPDVSGMSVLGIGYPTPYLNAYRNEADRVIAAMPASQGVVHWPGEGPGLTMLSLESELPLPDLSVDRVLMVHAVECAESLRPMMREVWRVLSGSGKLIVVTPNRRGIWARLDRTPFGFGRPYTPLQLSRLLRDTLFMPMESNGALFAPPSRSRMILSSANAWENIGSRWFSALGGVIVVEATKQIYSATPVGEGVRRRQLVTVTND